MTIEDYQRAVDQFESIRQWWSAQDETDQNEATTRFRLIDDLLTRVLEWPPEHIVCEDSLGRTFADYVLGSPTRRVVVEAKREGVNFAIPLTAESGVMSLRDARRFSPELAAAIDQVARYATDRGIAVAVATNGHQFVAFLASRQDGVAPADGKALLFSSLDAVSSQFALFWECLSRGGVEANALARVLAASPPPPPPAKLSTRLRLYPGFRTRNRLQTDLKVLGDLFLTDYLAAPEIEELFLRECYSTSDTLSEYATVSREVLEARYSAAQDADGAELQAARGTDAINPELARDVLTASLGRRPLILLGDVGVGKTTFIRHFIRIDARELMERSIVLHINFGDEPALASDLNAYVIDRLQEQLADAGFDLEDDKLLRQVYSHDLNRLTRGIYGGLRKSDPKAYALRELGLLEKKLAEPDKHLQAMLRHIAKSKKQQIIIFLDNIDQRDFEFQEEVFLIGQSLAATWPATVFLSLRPETFNRSRVHGSLTAYQPRIFTIAPPAAKTVIDKRLAFSIAQLGVASESEVIPPTLEAQAAALTTYLGILRNSFSINNELIEAVDNLGGGNLRATLDFVNTFVGSGHVDTVKIFGIHADDGRYRVALHEFLRALLFGDYEHYSPAASPIPNLLDISSDDGREHFIVPLILAHVERIGEVGSHDGYVDVHDIHDAMQGMGFRVEQIESALERAVNGKLLSHQPRAAPTDSRRLYRITTVGAYLWTKLLGRFTYLDAMIVDTPIVDPSRRREIKDCRAIADRLDRAEIFQKYLDDCWDPIWAEGQAFDWMSASTSLQRDVGTIRRSIKLNNL
ncbi:hypothetical protein [Paraconexibacter algicola]|uniref:AAA+ ATPase domain-containing protein n=1 Tax=Paraconexibacter algicola TaxID=2133960 RepID=A0A2T4UDH9_9ACTN|nr:hypothetical protein [Paraconexibacter algicola]PTL55566.1 hypothetical protein C7Y72_18140 [Paraconexibacter algicola]